MADTLNYKCPNCSAGLTFDSKSQKMKCEYCGSTYSLDELDKIREVRAMLNEKNLETDIQVDGGIYVENVREVLDAGANVIVAGSAVFRGDAGENTAKFMEILKSYE